MAIRKLRAGGDASAERKQYREAARVTCYILLGALKCQALPSDVLTFFQEEEKDRDDVMHLAGTESSTKSGSPSSARELLSKCVSV